MTTNASNFNFKPVTMTTEGYASGNKFYKKFMSAVRAFSFAEVIRNNIENNCSKKTLAKIVVLEVTHHEV